MIIVYGVCWLPSANPHFCSFYSVYVMTEDLHGHASET
jgi:hypothetical protein